MELDRLSFSRISESKFVCPDCGIKIVPNFNNLKMIGATFEMNAAKTKAIDLGNDGRTTVKFSTVDYFPKLLKVEYGETSFIVDRDDLKRMLEETQLLEED